MRSWHNTLGLWRILLILVLLAIDNSKRDTVIEEGWYLLAKALGLLAFVVIVLGLWPVLLVGWIAGLFGWMQEEQEVYEAHPGYDCF